MANYWLDANIFITTKEYYHPDIVPGFWQLLAQCTQWGIGSPQAVHDELTKGNDALATWAKAQKNAPLWVPFDPAVQATYTRIANYVSQTYRADLVADFLRGADAWLIAYASVHGGKITTFENRSGHGVTKLKIPSVGDRFQVTSVDVFMMLRELGVKFVL